MLFAAGLTVGIHFIRKNRRFYLVDRYVWLVKLTQTGNPGLLLLSAAQTKGKKKKNLGEFVPKVKDSVRL